MKRLRDWWTRRGQLAVTLILCVYYSIYTVRQVRSSFEPDSQQIDNVALDQHVSDFESFYRCALRMKQGLPMYFVDGTGPLEQPSKQAPFFELLLQPFVPFGIATTAVFFGVLNLLALLATLRVGKRLLRDRPGGKELGFGTVVLAMVVLFATLQLNVLYFQTAVLLVWLFVLGLSLLVRRPVLAGIVWSAAISMKVLPIVVLPWMVWRRQWRCVAGILLGLLATNAAVIAYTGWEKGVSQYQGFVVMLRDDPVFREYNERYQSIPPLVRATVTERYESQIRSTAQKRSWDGVRNFLGQTSLAKHADGLVYAAIGLLLAICALVCRPRGPTTTWRFVLEGSLVVIAMLLISPLTWRHYYWWVFPGMLAALPAVRERKVWAIVFVGSLLVSETLMHRGLFGSLATRWDVFHGRAVALIVAFCALAAHLARRGPDTENERSPA